MQKGRDLEHGYIIKVLNFDANLNMFAFQSVQCQRNSLLFEPFVINKTCELTKVKEREEFRSGWSKTFDPSGSMY